MTYHNYDEVKVDERTGLIKVETDEQLQDTPRLYSPELHREYLSKLADRF